MRHLRGGFALIEALLVIILCLMFLGAALGSVEALRRSLAQRALHEQRMEQWTRLSQLLRDDIRQARTLQLIPDKSAPKKTIWRVTRLDGSTVEYECGERTETHLYTEPLPAPPASSGKAKNKAALKPPPQLLLPFPPKTELRMRSLGFYLVRRIGGKQMQTEFPGVSSLRVHCAARAAAGVWALEELEAGRVLDALAQPYFVQVSIEQQSPGVPGQTLCAGAATRAGTPEGFAQ